MRKKENKKGGCLKKILIIFIVLIALGAIGGNGNGKQMPSSTQDPTTAPTEIPTTAPTVKPTEAPTEAPTAHPTATPEVLVIPGIDGSNAYDPIVDLENKGIAKPKTVTTADGIYEWSSDTVQLGDTYVSYQIHANKKHEILDATFTMYGKDNGFLTYAASLPYDGADTEKAAKFVAEHMTGESATTTIGDAIFAIYPNERGAMLEISDVDSEAFYSALLDKKLGL